MCFPSPVHVALLPYFIEEADCSRIFLWYMPLCVWVIAIMTSLIDAATHSVCVLSKHLSNRPGYKVCYLFIYLFSLWRCLEFSAESNVISVW